MNKNVKTLLLGGALVAGTLGSVVAFAQTSSQTTTQQTQTQPPPIVGSVQVGQGVAQYLDRATVSLQDAVAAAQQATGLNTSATSVELEVENGYLVWEVAIGDQEVIVDAGNGEVLQTMQAGMEDESEGMESEDEGAEHEGAENESGEREGAEDDD